MKRGNVWRRILGWLWRRPQACRADTRQSATEKLVTFTYDAGRLAQVTVPNGNGATYTCDGANARGTVVRGESDE